MSKIGGILMLWHDAKLVNPGRDKYLNTKKGSNLNHKVETFKILNQSLNGPSLKPCSVRTFDDIFWVFQYRINRAEMPHSTGWRDQTTIDKRLSLVRVRFTCRHVVRLGCKVNKLQRKDHRLYSNLNWKRSEKNKLGR